MGNPGAASGLSIEMEALSHLAVVGSESRSATAPVSVVFVPRCFRLRVVRRRELEGFCNRNPVVSVLVGVGRRPVGFTSSERGREPVRELVVE